MKTNWKIALLLDAAAGFSVSVFWSKGLISGFGAVGTLLVFAMLSALLTHD